MELMVKIEHKGQEGRAGYTTKSVHNSKTLRSAQNQVDANGSLGKNQFMRHCFAAPVATLGPDGRSASLGFYQQTRKGDRLYLFEFCQTIRTTLSSSENVASIRRRWADEGLVDDTSRWFMRALMHLRWFINDFAGFADMDNVLENLAEIPWSTVFPDLDLGICASLPRLAWLCVLDWGGCFRIGTYRDRIDNTLDKASAVAPLGMVRMATAVPKSSSPAPAFPRPENNGFGYISNTTLAGMARHRKEHSNGIGRLHAGDDGLVDPVMKAAWDTAASDQRVSPPEAMRWQAYMSGTLIYKALFCPRKAGQTLADYVEEQQYARESPAAMLEVMLRSVKPGVELQQPKTAESIANLLWHLMGHNRIFTEKDCRLHPAVTNQVLTKQEMNAVEGDGLLIGGRRGPAGTKWENEMLPPWRLVIEKGPDGDCWGMGLSADQDIEADQLAALYVGLWANDCDGFPTGRHNVRLGENRGFCLGELPLEVLLSVSAPGVFFNAAASQVAANLVLRRADAEKFRGLVYIPMYTRVRIRKGDFGHWHYDPFAGAGGADSYKFDDSQFVSPQPGGASRR